MIKGPIHRVATEVAAIYLEPSDVRLRRGLPPLGAGGLESMLHMKGAFREQDRSLLEPATERLTVRPRSSAVR